ncbi:MAG: response regulator [Anaerolineae bacterium]|nr:response regulator [Anaerolineae bacterium]
MNVLIVEDSHEVGRLVKEAILSLGSRIAVNVVPSAEEAMLEVGRQPADLLVVDIRLPGITGLELMKKMRTRRPGLKVIVITGLADDKLPGLTAELGVAGFFRKPVEMTPFLQRAAECLGLEFHQPGVPAGVGSVAEVLAGLRRTLGARGVFLLDGAGAVLAQDGSLPPGHAAEQRFPLLVAQPSAGLWRDHLGEGGSLVVRWGRNLALAVIAVDAERWLAAALPGGESALMSPALLPGMLQAAQTLARLSAELPAATPATPLPVEPPAEAPPAELETLTALLADSGGAVADADSFWEEASTATALPSDDQAAPSQPAIGQVLSEE